MARAISLLYVLLETKPALAKRGKADCFIVCYFRNDRCEGSRRVDPARSGVLLKPVYRRAIAGDGALTPV